MLIMIWDLIMMNMMNWYWLWWWKETYDNSNDDFDDDKYVDGCD